MNAFDSNKMAAAEELVNSFADTKATVKVVKKDKGLIERSVNDSKVIITEDNRQVLFG